MLKTVGLCVQGEIFGMLFNSCVTITPVGSGNVRSTDSFRVQIQTKQTYLRKSAVYIHFSDVYLLI